MMRLIKALPKSMLIATLVAFAILAGLGSWQLARLHWKNTLIAEMARTEALPPVPVAELLAQGHADWRSVALPSCRIEPARIIPMHSTMGPVAGYRLLTACPVAPGQPDMLVDLGFSEASNSVPANTTFLPVGRLRPVDKPSAFAPVNDPARKDWYSRSPAEMGKALNTQLRTDYFLVVDIKASHLESPAIRQAPMTAPLANRHLEYALTWYGLAVTLLAMVLAFAVQRSRKV
jgi:surfeit locus 1 family protein